MNIMKKSCKNKRLNIREISKAGTTQKYHHKIQQKE